MFRSSFLTNIGGEISQEDWDRFKSHMEKAESHLIYGYIRKQDNPDLLMIDRWGSETLCFSKSGADILHKRDWREEGMSVMVAGAFILFEQDCLQGRDGYEMTLGGDFYIVQEALEALRDAGVLKEGAKRTLLGREDFREEAKRAIGKARAAFDKAWNDSVPPDGGHIREEMEKAVMSEMPSGINDYWKDSWRDGMLREAGAGSLSLYACVGDDGEKRYFKSREDLAAHLGISNSYWYPRSGEYNGVNYAIAPLDLANLPKNVYNPAAEMMESLRHGVSDIVASAMNWEENPDVTRRRLMEAMADLDSDSRYQCLDNAVVRTMQNSFPGCLPESFDYYSDSENMKEALLEELEGLDYDDDGKNAMLDELVDSIRKKEEKEFAGDFSVETPDGMIIEISSLKCGELLEMEGNYPDLDEPSVNASL